MSDGMNESVKGTNQLSLEEQINRLDEFNKHLDVIYPTDHILTDVPYFGYTADIPGEEKIGIADS